MTKIKNRLSGVIRWSGQLRMIHLEIDALQTLPPSHELGLSKKVMATLLAFRHFGIRIIVLLVVDTVKLCEILLFVTTYLHHSFIDQPFDVFSVLDSRRGMLPQKLIIFVPHDV